jgi:hypothetical protein
VEARAWAGDIRQPTFGYIRFLATAGQYEGSPLDIAALFLWIFTAAAGLRLLAAGKPDRGPAVPPADSGTVSTATAPIPAGAVATSETEASAGAPVSSRGPASAGVPAAAAAAYAAGTGRPPPITHTRISTGPGEHPLLEFMHPALGIIGLGIWIAFVVTRFGAFAWVASGVVVVTIGAGLSWAASNARAARRRGPAPGLRFPARMIVAHGAAAAVTLVLAIVTVLTASHA